MMREDLLKLEKRVTRIELLIAYIAILLTAKGGFEILPIVIAMVGVQ